MAYFTKFHGKRSRCSVIIWVIVSDGLQVAQVQAQFQLTRVKSQFAADLLYILGGLTSARLITPSAK